jgi:hypothetical protein
LDWVRSFNLWLDRLPVLGFMVLNGLSAFSVLLGTSVLDHLSFHDHTPLLIKPAIVFGLSWAVVSALAREIRLRRQREREDACRAAQRAR